MQESQPTAMLGLIDRTTVARAAFSDSQWNELVTSYQNIPIHKKPTSLRIVRTHFETVLRQQWSVRSSSTSNPAPFAQATHYTTQIKNLIK
jgi:hypothetical protein